MYTSHTTSWRGILNLTDKAVDPLGELKARLVELLTPSLLDHSVRASVWGRNWQPQAYGAHGDYEGSPATWRYSGPTVEGGIPSTSPQGGCPVPAAGGHGAH